MIEKFESFSKEFNSPTKISRGLKDFERALESSQEELSQTYISFSEHFNFYANKYRVAKSKEKEDPDRDFNSMNSQMQLEGWSIERVMSLKKAAGNNAIIVKGEEVSKSPGTDYYLYKITDKEFPLSGMTYKDLLEDDRAVEEIGIKYSYGFHKTNYGKLFIKQNFGTLENFYESFAKILPEYCLEHSDVFNLDMTIEEFKSFFLISGNEIIIDVDDLVKSTSESKNNIVYALKTFCNRLGCQFIKRADEFIIKVC
jgi:hypothetical protein